MRKELRVEVLLVIGSSQQRLFEHLSLVIHFYSGYEQFSWKEVGEYGEEIVSHLTAEHLRSEFWL